MWSGKLATFRSWEMRSQERLEKSEKEDARSGMLRARDCAQGVQGAPGRADGLQGRVLPSRASSLSDNLVKNTPGFGRPGPRAVFANPVNPERLTESPLPAGSRSCHLQRPALTPRVELSGPPACLRV